MRTKRFPSLALPAVLGVFLACIGCEEKPEVGGPESLADGLARFRAGDLDPLRTDVGARLKRQPTDPEALLLRARIARVDDDYYGLGFSSIRRVLEVTPDHLDGLRLLGSFELDKGRLQAAADAFDKVLAIDADDPMALAGLAAIDMQRGDLETATTRLASADQSKRRNDPYWLLWRGKAELTDPAVGIDEAIGSLARAHQIDSQDFRIGVAFAEALWVRGDTERGDRELAETVLRRIYERNPNHLEAPTLLAELLLSQGKARAAVAVLEPLDDELESGRSVAILGKALFEVERFDDAETQLKRALRFGAPDRGTIELLRARIAIQNDDREAAAKALKRARTAGADRTQVDAVQAELDGD